MSPLDPLLLSSATRHHDTKRRHCPAMASANIPVLHLCVKRLNEVTIGAGGNISVKLTIMVLPLAASRNAHHPLIKYTPMSIYRLLDP
jgi:hypothetical protein